MRDTLFSEHFKKEMALGSAFRIIYYSFRIDKAQQLYCSYRNDDSGNCETVQPQKMERPYLHFNGFSFGSECTFCRI